MDLPLSTNNIETDLSHRLQQKYDRFTPLQQGVPLLFILLLQDLLLSTESSLKGLYEQLRVYHIDKVSGENIKTVSTIVLSIANRIWYSNKQNFPSGFIDTVIKLYQTSSVLISMNNSAPLSTLVYQNMQRQKSPLQ